MLTTDFQSMDIQEQLSLTYKEGTLLTTVTSNTEMRSLYYLDSHFVDITCVPTLKGWFTTWQVSSIRHYLDMPSNTDFLEPFIERFSVDDLSK
ncbi:hypothetical protein F5984_00920 [Rudanella paleaurantiibacter]|uniref:Uncharacterized protein n=1 Tax=Rudanella paleaurantiibacter TaxID=2614655 RepID=A0A7J5U494_9BACT|nr:hypothetical protein [Rudanella paleaurantiibacter]KAB7732551.1 hypothetical protein F5984_00920 [Rudanella paleaurantiibacter]